jgi:hypothetical protein
VVGRPGSARRVDEAEPVAAKEHRAAAHVLADQLGEAARGHGGTHRHRAGRIAQVARLGHCQIDLERRDADQRLVQRVAGGVGAHPEHDLAGEAVAEQVERDPLEVGARDARRRARAADRQRRREHLLEAHGASPGQRTIGALRAFSS